MLKNHDDVRLSEVSPVLRIDQVADLLGCSTKHIQTLSRQGRFAPRTVISDRVYGWRACDLEEWLKASKEEIR